jgi:hypothetical protein
MPDNPAAETAQDVTAHPEFPGRATVLLMAAVLGAIVAGTIALWVHYGTAVFFETIRAGFAACFG